MANPCPRCLCHPCHPSDASAALAPLHSIPLTSPSSLGPICPTLLLFQPQSTAPDPSWPIILQDSAPSTCPSYLPAPPHFAEPHQLPVPSCPKSRLLSKPPATCSPFPCLPTPSPAESHLASSTLRLPIYPSSLHQLSFSQDLPQPCPTQSSARTPWALAGHPALRCLPQGGRKAPAFLGLMERGHKQATETHNRGTGCMLGQRMWPEGEGSESVLFWKGTVKPGVL